MDDQTTRWGVGLAVTVSIAAIGTIIQAFRNMSAKILALHKRIDAVKDDYVRRDDLDKHMAGLEKMFDLKTDQLTEEITELRDDLREHNKRVIDALSRR